MDGVSWIILLTVTLVMPEDRPDIAESHKLHSMGECWAAAQSWMEQDAKALGGIGLAARCAKVEAPGENG